METRVRRWLVRPLSLILDLILWGTGAVVLVIAVGSVLGMNLEWRIGGLEDSRVCVRISAGEAYHADYKISPPDGRAPKSGTEAHADEIAVCRPDPSPSERWLGGVAELPGFALTVGMLLGLRILLSRVRRRGPHDVSVSRFSRKYGMALIVGAFLCALVAKAGRTAFLDKVTPQGVTGDIPGGWDHILLDSLGDLRYEAILLGLVMILVSKVLGHGADKADDLVDAKNPGSGP